jgi:hypothetical protein
MKIISRINRKRLWLLFQLLSSEDSSIQYGKGKISFCLNHNAHKFIFNDDVFCFAFFVFNQVCTIPWAFLLPAGPLRAHHQLNFAYQFWVHTKVRTERPITVDNVADKVSSWCDRRLNDCLVKTFECILARSNSFIFWWPMCHVNVEISIVYLQ